MLIVDFDINNLDSLYRGERGNKPEANQRCMMIEVVYDGNRFKFCREGKRAYWLCVSRDSNTNSQAFSGANCVAPSGFWKDLRAAAVETGVDESLFSAPVKEKKTRKRSKKDRDLLRNVISIF
jgi:hypothetical protein